MAALAPNLRRIVALTLLSALLAAPLGTVAGSALHLRQAQAFNLGGPADGLFQSTTNVTSSNWAGYAIKTAAGAVTDVRASWQVPQIAKACPSANRYSSFWVGIDGDGSKTVEQTGTETDCSSGSPVYFA